MSKTDVEAAKDAGLRNLSSKKRESTTIEAAGWLIRSLKMKC